MKIKCILIGAFLTQHLFANAPPSQFDTKAQAIRGNSITLTVGTDVNCDFNSIQSAINTIPSPNSDFYFIRVSNQQTWFESLQIDNKDNVNIWGGFNNCIDADNGVVSGDLSVLNGNISSQPALFVNAARSTNLLFMRIQNTNPSGGVVIDNASSMNIVRSEILNNGHTTVSSNGTVGEGGGIEIKNDSFLRLSNSLVSGNEALNGGGIACNDAQLDIINSSITDNSTVFTSNNFADRGKGGGIYATNMCRLSIENYISGGNQGTGFGKKIQNNTATIQGGGLYADDDSTVIINGDPNRTQTAQPVVFENNRIIHNIQFVVRGAGIAVSDPGTEVTAYYLAMIGNNIDPSMLFGRGGGLSVNNHAKFSLRTEKFGNQCIQDITNPYCNQFVGNSVNSGSGGAIAVGSDAEVEIYQTIMTNNLAESAPVASMFGGTLNMQGNMIYANGSIFNLVADEMFSIAGDANIHIDFSTIVDNFMASGALLRTSGADNVRLTRSILDANINTTVFSSNSQNPNNLNLFKCLLTHENNSFFGTNIMVAQAVFTTNYHLSPFSPGLAMCDQGPGDLIPEIDIDGEVRPGCTSQICPAGSFDVGADATFWFDIIFMNSFEPPLL